MGGSETYARALLARFAAGEGPERVTVLVPAGARASLAPLARGPVELHPVRYRPGRSGLPRLAAQIWGQSPFLRAVPPGAGAVHYPLTVPVPAPTAPAVVSLHDIAHHEVPSMFPAAERRLRALTYDRPARRAAAVITGTEHARASIVERLGVDPARVHVAPYGVDRERFSPDGPPPAFELPERYVLYPANRWPHKNHERLLRALDLVRDADLHLVLTGRGAPVRHPRVRDLGYVAPDVLPALMRAARGLVFPSLFEGFGQPVLEAMACGCPVACSGSGALGEVAGDAALTFDPHDIEQIAAAIDRLGDDDDLRRRGLERVRRFTWEASARRHLEVYELAETTAGPH